MANEDNAVKFPWIKLTENKPKAAATNNDWNEATSQCKRNGSCSAYLENHIKRRLARLRVVYFIYLNSALLKACEPRTDSIH